MKIKLAVSFLAFVLSATANAQWFGGISAGQSKSKLNSNDWDANDSTTWSGSSNNVDKTAWKIFGGYEYNKNLAVELGYAHFGSPSKKITGIGVRTGDLISATAKEYAWYLAGKATLPINEQFGIFGKLGATWNKSKLNVVSNDAAINAFKGWPYDETKTRTSVLYGVGAEYNFNKQAGIRLEYENFGRFGNRLSSPPPEGTGRTKVDMWSLGLAYKF